MKLGKELILYVIFGVLTTLVNIFVYLFFAKLCGVNYIISNILAWFFSVLFAYITNRILVFESTNINIIKEISLFFGGRLFSCIVDTGLMYLFIDIFSIGDFISKILIQIIVVILNYIISKLFVFNNH
jgi:putative flippase GtrA